MNWEDIRAAWRRGANYDPGLLFWDRFSTIVSFLSLWLTLSAFIHANDTSSVSWLILALALGNFLGYLARFDALIKVVIRRDWLRYMICFAFLSFMVWVCYRTALWIYI